MRDSNDKRYCQCKKKKKKFGLAVCDAASFKDKRDLNVDFYKLLSIGIDDYELIEMLKIKKKPIFISTGFNVTERKIKKSIRLFYNSNPIQLLHTPMTYTLDELNLKKINISGKDYLGRKYKIPHMGWNTLKVLDKKNPILKNIKDDEQFYFVHSYYLTKCLEKEVLAKTVYSHDIPAIIGEKNYYGVQFHPEKSSFAGQKFISNWIRL